jgi:hypothetical protein
VSTVGARHYVVFVFFCFFTAIMYVLNVLAIPLSTAQFCNFSAIADTIGKEWQIHFRTSPNLSCHLCCANTIATGIFTPFICKALQKK